MTKEEMIEIIKGENPILKTGNDNDGYVEIEGQEYDAIIEEWAINRLEHFAKVEAEEAAKAEVASKRQALLDRLGITEEEARLLLG